MFENPRRGRKARNFTTNAPKVLDLKSSSEQIFSRKLPLGAPDVARVKKERDLLGINIAQGPVCQLMLYIKKALAKLFA